MCLPDLERFEQVSEDSPVIGYRNWRTNIKNPKVLKSSARDYTWKPVEGPHEVLDKDSGIYSYDYNGYNNYNYNNNNYYNNYNYYNYDYNYYNNNSYNYYLGGIIKQYGKVAIHKIGYRSEYAVIDTLFTIRESDAEGLIEFLNWIKTFNSIINKLAEKYNCKTQHWQDFQNEQS